MRAFVRVAAALALAVAAGRASAQPADPEARIRVQILGDSEVLVSQPARVAVDVLVPTYFSGSPRFPDELDLEDAFTLLLPGWSLNLTESIGGRTWSGIRRTYTVFPLQPGSIVVPAVEVEVRWASESGTPSDWRTLRSEPLSLRAVLPAGAGRVDPFFATPEFSLDESYEPDPTTLRVGDSVTRVVTLEVVGTPSFFLPDLDFPPMEGLGIYPAAPRSRDFGGERGSARTGRKTESVTYALEREGSFTLPAIEIDWWRLPDGSAQTSSLPSTTLEVRANDELDAEQTAVFVEPPSKESPEADRRWIEHLSTWGPIGLIGLIFALIAIRLGPRAAARVREGWALARIRRANSEPARFAAFVRAARGGSAAATYPALARWIESVVSREQTPSAFADEVGDPALDREIGRLLASLWARDGGSWSPAELIAAVSHVRTARMRAAAGALGSLSRSKTLRHHAALPPLNPTRSSKDG